MLISNPIAESGRLLHPDEVGPVGKSPSLKDVERRLEMRRRCPQEQRGVCRRNLCDWQRPDLLQCHRWVMRFGRAHEPGIGVVHFEGPRRICIDDRISPVARQRRGLIGQPDGPRIPFGSALGVLLEMGSAPVKAVNVGLTPAIMPAR